MRIDKSCRDPAEHGQLPTFKYRQIYTLRLPGHSVAFANIQASLKKQPISSQNLGEKTISHRSGRIGNNNTAKGSRGSVKEVLGVRLDVPAEITPSISRGCRSNEALPSRIPPLRAARWSAARLHCTPASTPVKWQPLASQLARQQQHSRCATQRAFGPAELGSLPPASGPAGLPALTRQPAACRRATTSAQRGPIPPPSEAGAAPAPLQSRRGIRPTAGGRGRCQHGQGWGACSCWTDRRGTWVAQRRPSAGVKGLCSTDSLAPRGDLPLAAL